MGGPAGLDIAELRARIRPGFDAARVVAIAQRAEAAIVLALTPKEGLPDEP